MLESRTSPIAEYPGAATAPIRARLAQTRDADGDTWFVLYVNGVEVHRELAAYQDLEPARRLLRALRERYADRLRSFECAGAEDYLVGASTSLGADLRELVADLPERDGADPANDTDT